MIFNQLCRSKSCPAYRGTEVPLLLRGSRYYR
jgi:hypothetical protein